MKLQMPPARASLSSPARPPGPAGHPIIGSIGALRKETHRALVNARETHGDLVYFRVGPRHVYLVCHPDDVRHVLVENHRNFRKGRALQKAKPLLGEGLLTSEGDFWRRQRRLAQPAFHRERIAALGGVVTAATSELLESWSPLVAAGPPLELDGEMMKLTLDVVGKALFGTALTGAEIGTVASVLPPLLRDATARTHSVFDFGERLPTPSNRRRDRNRMSLDRIVYRIIEERRRSGEEATDLLGMLMVSRDEETGETMTDVQLRDEVMTLFLAGHETTALLLSWTWTLLSRHPGVRRRVEAEVDRVVGERTPTAADVAHLPYLRMVLDEVLRLYPPAWAIPRTAVAEDVIHGYPVPAGATVILSPYVTHRHPEFWENPEGFDPERFSPERSAHRHRHAYFPFGGGPRLCIGNNFALMEATLIVAMVVQRYTVDLVPGQRIEPEAAFTLRPRSGVLARLLRRRPDDRVAVATP